MAKDLIDYSTLLRQEPERFRGLGQGGDREVPCGKTMVKPTPKRAAPRPQPFRGLGQKLKPCDTPDSEFDPRELQMGIETEMEHTEDPETAKCIAKHHLVEEAEAKGLPLKSRRVRYYRDLKNMEMRWKKIGDRRRSK